MTPARSNSARSAPAESCEKAGGQNGSHDFLDKIDAETFPSKGTPGQRKPPDPCLNLDLFSCYSSFLLFSGLFALPYLVLVPIRNFEGHWVR